MDSLTLRITKIDSVCDAYEVANLEVLKNDKSIYDCSIWTDDEDEPLKGSLHFFMPEYDGELSDFSFSDLLTEEQVSDFNRFYLSKEIEKIQLNPIKHIADLEFCLLSERGQ